MYITNITCMTTMSRNLMLVLVLGIALPGCSNMAESFDSKPGKGVVASISKTNALVDEGIIPFAEDEGGPTDYNKDSQRAAPLLTGVSRYPVGKGSVLKRMPEKAMRVWLAPYTDRAGHFHEGSFVYTVLTKSHWAVDQVVDPVDDPLTPQELSV